MEFEIRKMACVAADTPKTREGFATLEEQYPLAALEGDGFMLQSVHAHREAAIPIYGMNCGSIGFLLNRLAPDGLMARLNAARPHILVRKDHPSPARLLFAPDHSLEGRTLNEQFVH